MASIYLLMCVCVYLHMYVYNLLVQSMGVHCCISDPASSNHCETNSFIPSLLRLVQLLNAIKTSSAKEFVENSSSLTGKKFPINGVNAWQEPTRISIEWHVHKLLGVIKHSQSLHCLQKLTMTENRTGKKRATYLPIHLFYAMYTEKCSCLEFFTCKIFTTFQFH